MIRLATADDAPGITRVEREVQPAAWPEATVLRYLGKGTSSAWVDDAGGHIAAHLLTTVVLDEAEVLTVATATAHRREGRARSLMNHAAIAWAASGVRSAFLEVRQDNHAARELYTSLGWKEAGTRAGYYRDGTDALQMRLEVDCSG